MTFWAVSGAASLLVSIFLILPLLRKPKGYAPRTAYDQKIYFDQLAEVEEDIKRETISSEEAESARAEVRRRLLASPKEEKSNIKDGIGVAFRRAALILTIVLIPTGAMSTYLQLGAPGLSDAPLASRGQEIKQAEQSQQIEDMVDKLAAKLEENQDDVKGWKMLGRSYRVLDRLEDSALAYSRAYALEPENTAMALEYAETLIFIEKGYVNPKARTIIEKALSSEPKNFKARFYLGMALAETTEELPKAIKVWEELLADSPEGSPWVPSLKEHLGQAREAAKKASS